MLSHLTLKDFAVVSAAELAFDRGMTVVSGETGAGKSLMVDALLSLTGARADAGDGPPWRRARRTGRRIRPRAMPPRLAPGWRENELDEGGDCQLRRVIRADGGSRAWINGRPATLAQLSELGGQLVEIHGQHEHQALLERGHQLELLDAFGQHEPVLRRSRRHTRRRWTGIERELAELVAGPAMSASDVAYLQHQIAELMREALDAERHRRDAGSAPPPVERGRTCSAATTRPCARLSGDDGYLRSREACAS